MTVPGVSFCLSCYAPRVSRTRRTVTRRQADVVRARLDPSDAPPTYAQVAERLGIQRGTVHCHLGRVRANEPELYQDVRCGRCGSRVIDVRRR